MTLNSLLKSRYRNYIFLVLLAVVSLAYQITYTVVSIQATLNWQRVTNVPFTLNDDATVNAVNNDTTQAGLMKGDEVLRVNKREVTGNRVLFEEVARHAPGQSLAVEVLSPGQSSPRVVNVPLKAGRDGPPTPGSWLLESFLMAITMLCLCAGIYVALVRPDDIRALIVGGLLLSISQMVTTVVPVAFPEELWRIAFSSRLVVALWPIWMLLFGLYFPQRLEWEKRHAWFKWLVIGPQLTILAAAFVDLNVSLDRFLPVRVLDHLLSNSITGWLQGGLTLIGLAAFSSLASRSMRPLSQTRIPDAAFIC